MCETVPMTIVLIAAVLYLLATALLVRGLAMDRNALPRTWLLLRAAAQVLMQGVPAGLDIDEVRDAMQATPGVATVHDLHVWALGSREPILTAHVLLSDEAGDADALRGELAGMLGARFDIDHVTLQMEARHCGGVHH